MLQVLEGQHGRAVLEGKRDQRAGQPVSDVTVAVGGLAIKRTAKAFGQSARFAHCLAGFAGNPRQPPIPPVDVRRAAEELASEDRAVGAENAPGRRGIDAQIERRQALGWRGVTEHRGFEGTGQPHALSAQQQRGCLGDVAGQRVAVSFGRYRQVGPDPIGAVPDLERRGGALGIKRQALIPVQRRIQCIGHGARGRRSGTAFALPGLPLLVAGDEALDLTDRRLDGGPTQVARKLVEAPVEEPVARIRVLRRGVD